ncbi:MAG: hypothetical protein J6S75_14915, partial [Thermoguttaceae bacterium]|nr:hypothetical protein [Thermoguttaceae bacterium]
MRRHFRLCFLAPALLCGAALCGCSSGSAPEPDAAPRPSGDTAVEPAAPAPEAAASPLVWEELPAAGAVLETNDDGTCRVLNLTDAAAESLAGGIDANDEQLKNIRVVRGKGTISKDLAGLFARMPRLAEFLWVEAGDSAEAVDQLAALPVKKLRLCGLSIDPSGYSFLARLAKVEDLDISGSSVDDQACGFLASAAALKKLNLYQTAVTDAGLAALAPLADHVTWLNLDATAVTDAGMEPLKSWTKLTFLHLGRTSIDDQAVEPLSTLTALEKLHVTRTQMTEEGMAALQEKLPNCQVV